MIGGDDRPTPLDESFERLATWSATAALAFACGGLAGWWLDLAGLLHLGTTTATMKLNTALSLVALAGAALVAISRRRGAMRYVRALAGGVIVLVVVSALQDPLGIDLGIDMLFAPGADPAPGGAPGRMAATTGAQLVLLACALTTFGRGPATSILALAATIPALVAIAGHIYGAEALYGAIGFTRQALPTALACATLGIALLLARPRDGVFAPLATDTVAATSARRMLPILLVIPLLLGWLRLQGQYLGWYGTEFGIAVLAVGSSLTLLGVALYQARGMVRLERARDGLVAAAARDREAAAVEHRYRDVVMGAPAGMFLTDAAGACTFVNAQWQRLTGMSFDAALGEGWRGAIHPDDRPLVYREWDAATREKRMFELGYRYLGPAGEIRWVECSTLALRDDAGEITGHLGVVIDVSERRAAIEALARSEENFRNALERAPLGFVMLQGATIAYVNPVVAAMFGYDDPADMVGLPWVAFLDGDEAIAGARERFAQVMAGQPPPPHPTRMRRRDGTTLVVESSPAIMTFDGKPTLGAFVRDITERETLEHVRAAAEARLRASLAEKETLLHEVHHRVKNNLQIVASLLSLQSAGLVDPGAKAAFGDLRGRIRAIASVHERLYSAPDVARIDVAAYLREFARELSRALAQPGSSIAVEVDADDVALTIERIVPLALLVNELVTNAFKHAFGDARHGGRVSISLREDEGDIVLRVTDDGVGMPAATTRTTHRGLGMSLVRGLAAQLGGTVSFDSAGGTTCTLRFPARRADSEVPT